MDWADFAFAFLLGAWLIYSGSKSKGWIARGWRYGLGIILLLMSLVFIPNGASESEASKTEVEAKATATYAQTTPSTKPPRAAIPGLEWTDIVLNLERQPFGFKFKRVKLEGAWAKTANKVDPDTGARMTVEVVYDYGVYRVQADVSGASAYPTASWLLPYVATLPYDGSSPREAKTWVAEALKSGKKVQTRHFGPATFEVYVTSPTYYGLKIYPTR